MCMDHGHIMAKVFRHPMQWVFIIEGGTVQCETEWSL